MLKQDLLCLQLAEGGYSFVYLVRELPATSADSSRLEFALKKVRNLHARPAQITPRTFLAITLYLSFTLAFMGGRYWPSQANSWQMPSEK